MRGLILVMILAALLIAPAEGKVVGFEDGQCAEIGDMLDCEASEIMLLDTLYTVGTWHRQAGKLR